MSYASRLDLTATVDGSLLTTASPQIVLQQEYCTGSEHGERAGMRDIAPLAISMKRRSHFSISSISYVMLAEKVLVQYPAETALQQMKTNPGTISRALDT